MGKGSSTRRHPSRVDSANQVKVGTNEETTLLHLSEVVHASRPELAKMESCGARVLLEWCDAAKIPGLHVWARAKNAFHVPESAIVAPEGFDICQSKPSL